MSLFRLPGAKEIERERVGQLRLYRHLQSREEWATARMLDSEGLRCGGGGSEGCDVCRWRAVCAV